MSEKSAVTGRQIAAARALLGMDQKTLAETAEISVPTLKRMEAATGPAQGMRNNVRAVVTALENAGIDFITKGDGGGIGLRFRSLNGPG